MKDPYARLGITPQADDTQLREAYRKLAREYQDDPRKMAEIDGAYDAIILSRGSAGGAGQYEQRSGRSYENVPPADGYAPDYADIRRRIQAGRLDDALTLLDGVPPAQRPAEWYYLKGCVQRGRGWLEEAEANFAQAVRLAPGHPEYRTAYDKLYASRSGGYRARRSGNSDEDRCCKVCTGLLCADCCCECFGGDLIPCI
ncbi:MAG: molecular chaperone DnaJ [Oscillospiraceae bacterium]|jgi:curved DNA-binding protein CbpA|nr:molecular chaperone DnaJ [Oscillospiraceae bacterium]